MCLGDTHAPDFVIEQAMSPFVLIPFCLLMALAACEPTIANRGAILEADKLATLKVGTSTREDVATQIGTPTQISTFDSKIWYYIGRKTQQFSFLDPEILEQKVIEIRFDDQGVVTALQTIDPANTEDIHPVDRRTPTYGNDSTLIQQLLGNLARPTPLGKKQQGQ